MDFIRIMREMILNEAEEMGIRDSTSMVTKDRGEKKLTRQA